MLRASNMVEKKSALFCIVFAAVVGSLTPSVILPHIFHEHHILHILLHVAGLGLSSFLTIIAAMAFYRLRTRRMALTTIAFLIFCCAESISLADTVQPIMSSLGTIPALEVVHLLMIISMGLLALGAFRND